MDMRVGKTPTALKAIEGELDDHVSDLAVVLYPASVQGEWERQAKEWVGIPFITLEGLKSGPSPVPPSGPYILGCHYEILRDWVLAPGSTEDKPIPGPIFHYLCGSTDLQTRPREFVLVLDEVQRVQNRKSGFYRAAKFLAERATARWGLTGTPMRNRSKNMYAIFDTLLPKSMSKSYWTYAKRFCGAHIGDDGYWTDDEDTNSEELAARLKSISYRRTRADVASDLPKSDRSVILCDLPAKDMKRYEAVEAKFGKEIAKALEDPEGAGIGKHIVKELVAATTAAKIPTLVSRVEHYVEAGHKIVVFAHLHETTDRIIEALAGAGLKIFQIDGRVDKAERVNRVAEWRGIDGAAVLVAGTLAAGVGIDLSDAEAALFVELEWVPADFRQAEDRIVDVHQGKRSSPPLYEYIIARGTIDEGMIHALLSKVRSIEAVVGADNEMSSMKRTLGSAQGKSIQIDGNSDEDTIREALADVRRRMLGLAESDGSSIVGAVASHDWDDQNSDQAEDEP